MKIRKLHFDVRFWILFLFVIRLVGITNPPLEVGHNWRQTTVTMVARNFYEVDAHIMFPRIDIAGEKTGITGMEFPILNYMIYLVSEIFGYAHWYGRLINLIVSSFGLWFFFLLVRKYFDEKVGLYATIILGFSVWFQFSRKIMPDTFSMSLMFMALYFGTNYLDNKSNINKVWNLLFYAITLCISVLSKLPTGFIIVVLGIFFLDKNILISRKIIFSLVSFCAAILVYLWYYVWVPNLVEVYGFWHFFMGKSMNEGVREILNNIPETLSRFYETAINISGFLFFLVGIFFSIRKRNFIILYVFIISFAAFLVIIFKAGFTFHHHNYYIIPFAPVMALVAAYGISMIKNSNLVFLLLLVFSIEGVTSQYQDFFIKDKKLGFLNLEGDLNKVSKADDLILINSGKYPTAMYFAHRKGWIEYNNKIKDQKYLNDLKAKGLKYIVILKDAENVGLPNYKKVLENQDYDIYKVD